MREYDKEAVIRKLHAMSISPKRSLGQNFLISQRVIEKIIQKVQDLQPQSLIEVGPGLGALTDHLRQMPCPLLLIELDRTFASYWRDQGLNVREGDALRMSWQEFSLTQTTLVSNLPYQISSSLVIERCIDPAGIENMVLMFQKEVAQRILAIPGSKEYGLLTIIAQAFWDVKMLLEAGPNEFYPSPNVASRVLSFQRKPEFLGDSRDFLEFVKAGFAQRRKLLISNLSPIMKKTNSTKEQWEVKLLSLGYKPGVRAEEVSVEHWVWLFNMFFTVSR